MMKWQPIEELNVTDRTMFVVKAFDASIGQNKLSRYTSDPWCVWLGDDGEFVRWPHPFAPTHFCFLPEKD